MGGEKLKKIRYINPEDTRQINTELPEVYITRLPSPILRKEENSLTTMLKKKEKIDCYGNVFLEYQSAA